MKKGQVLEGTIEKVEFPNKGVVTVAEEGKSVIVKNGCAAFSRHAEGVCTRLCLMKHRWK